MFSFILKDSRLVDVTTVFVQLKMSCSDCKCPFCVECVYQFEVKTTLFCKMMHMFVLFTVSMKVCLDFVTIPRRSLLTLNYFKG